MKVLIFEDDPLLQGMYAANNDQPWLYGFVPVMGYILSTLSLPSLKKWWMKGRNV